MRTITFEAEVHGGIIKIPEQYENLGIDRIGVTLFVKEPEIDSVIGSKSRTRARGILTKYKNPALRRMEKSAWGMAIKDKHGSG